MVGIDLDPIVVDLARLDAKAAGLDNIEFRCGQADEIEAGHYDVAYARFLLSHVSDPSQIVEAMTEAVRPGGAVVIEDIDFTGYFCYPPCPSHDRYVEWYRETVRRRGGDADLGPRLPSLLHQVGLEGIGVRVWQECALEGEAKLIPPLTLARIADSVVAEGVAPIDEVEKAVAELYEHGASEGTLMGMPRVIQAWAWKPGSQSST